MKRATKVGPKLRKLAPRGIPRRIQKARMSAGLTRGDLSERTGIPVPVLNAIEQGKRPANGHAEAINKALGLNIVSERRGRAEPALEAAVNGARLADFCFLAATMNREELRVAHLVLERAISRSK